MSDVSKARAGRVERVGNQNICTSLKAELRTLGDLHLCFSRDRLEGFRNFPEGLGLDFADTISLA
jgi:hypothetical protein